MSERKPRRGLFDQTVIVIPLRELSLEELRPLYDEIGEQIEALMEAEERSLRSSDESQSPPCPVRR